MMTGLDKVAERASGARRKLARPAGREGRKGKEGRKEGKEREEARSFFFQVVQFR